MKQFTVAFFGLFLFGQMAMAQINDNLAIKMNTVSQKLNAHIELLQGIASSKSGAHSRLSAREAKVLRTQLAATIVKFEEARTAVKKVHTDILVKTNYTSSAAESRTGLISSAFDAIKQDINRANSQIEFGTIADILGPIKSARFTAVDCIGNMLLAMRDAAKLENGATSTIDLNGTYNLLRTAFATQVEILENEELGAGGNRGIRYVSDESFSLVFGGINRTPLAMPAAQALETEKIIAKFLVDQVERLDGLRLTTNSCAELLSGGISN